MAKKQLLIIFLCTFAGMYLSGADLIDNVVPRPQQYKMEEGEIIIDRKPDIISLFCYEEKPLKDQVHALDMFFRDTINDLNTIGITVLLADVSSKEWQEKSLPSDIPLPLKNDAYTLHIDEKSITVLGYDSRGLYYGLQTLQQLFSVQDSKIRLPRGLIQDYPALEFRGLHFRRRIASEKSLEEQKRLLDFMARHKMNYAVMQMDYLLFDNLPEMHYKPLGQDKDMYRQLIDYARRRYIEIIPLVPSYGHAEWAFKSGEYLDIAENPDNPYAFRVNYERTYKVLFKIFDEVLDLFKTNKIHIGFDEVDLPAFGKYPFREETKEHTMEELLKIHLRKIADYLAERDLDKILLWGDMFLSRGDAPAASPAAASAPCSDIARKRRQILSEQHQNVKKPRLLICDWHYQPGPQKDFTSLNAWQESGIPVIAATWYNPYNIRNFALQAIDDNAYGLLQTTWAGFDFSIEETKNHHHQFEAYLLAADYAWSGRKERPDELPYQYSSEFWRRWDRQRTCYEGMLPVDMLGKNEMTRIVKRYLQTSLEPDLHELKACMTNVQYSWTFSLKNPFNKDMHISITGDYFCSSKEMLLKPLETVENSEISFLVPGDEIHPSQTLHVEMTVLFGDKKMEINKEVYIPPVWQAGELQKAPVVNGDLTDWKGHTSFILKDERFVDRKKNWYPEDLSAEILLGHYDGSLYFAFLVRDDKHYNSYVPPQMWQGDAVQIALDFGYERTPFFSEKILEFGVALDNNGEVMLYSWNPHQIQDSGFMKEIDAHVVRDEPYTVYEITVPLDILNVLSKNDILGFSFSINDNDGTGFDGGIIGSQGIWGVKNPAMFGTLFLQ